MITIRILIPITSVLLVLCGCSKDEAYQLSEVISLKNSDLFNTSHCFSISRINAVHGLFINNEATYKMYEDSMRYQYSDIKIDCDTATLRSIDFDKYSLIGIATGYGACDSINREFIIDDSRKELLYSIDIKKHTGFCILIAIWDLNLALITKLPEDYSVRFTVFEHY